MELVKLSSVTKSFGAVRAVDALDLSLGQGEILGFLGTNGAGKTTTIKMLLGLIAPDAGGVAVFGADPRRASTRRRIGFMPETAHYYPFLTARELLRFYGGLCGMDAAGIASRAGELLEKVGLAEAGGRQLKTYSKGMLQRWASPRRCCTIGPAHPRRTSSPASIRSPAFSSATCCWSCAPRARRSSFPPTNSRRRS